MYLLRAINGDRQHNCWMSSDRLQYINREGGKKVVEVNGEQRRRNHSRNITGWKFGNMKCKTSVLNSQRTQTFKKYYI
jgi:hypothetical protein